MTNRMMLAVGCSARKPLGSLKSRTSMLTLLCGLLLASAMHACDEAKESSDPAGVITGKVTVDGEGLGGVSVSLSNGDVRTTTEEGSYRFSVLKGGSYTVAVSDYPAEASFSHASIAATIASVGQTVTVDFSGTWTKATTLAENTPPNKETLDEVTDNLACAMQERLLAAFDKIESDDRIDEMKVAAAPDEPPLQRAFLEGARLANKEWRARLISASGGDCLQSRDTSRRTCPLLVRIADEVARIESYFITEQDRVPASAHITEYTRKFAGARVSMFVWVPEMRAWIEREMADASCASPTGL